MNNIEKYGWWDEAGRNIFWQFPQVVFTNIDKEEDKHRTLHEIFIQGKNEQPQQLIERLIETMIGLLTYEGKLNSQETEICSTIRLSNPDLIIVKVSGDIEIFQDILKAFMLRDARFSTYSKARPIETYPD